MSIGESVSDEMRAQRAYFADYRPAYLCCLAWNLACAALGVAAGYLTGGGW